MDYLQYPSQTAHLALSPWVLNLVINGLPSIQEIEFVKPLSELEF